MDNIREEVRLIIAVVLALIIIIVFGRFRAPQQNIPQQPTNSSVISGKEVPIERDVVSPPSHQQAGEEKIYENDMYIIRYDTAGGIIN